MGPVFRWDPEKARSNLRKHRVTFEEADFEETIRIFSARLATRPERKEYEEATL